jgi:hypothetical protein
MSLTEEQKRKIEEIIERSLLEKLKRYKPETFSMPFHYRLLGKDRMALYSFIWTMRGVIDIERELKVAEEFWDLLGGDGSYEELLNCFERVGIKLRPVLDRYFSKFRS